MIQNLLAQVPKDLGPIGCGPGFPIPCEEIQTGAQTFGKMSAILSLIIGFITVVAGIYFLFQLIIGAFAWISSSGDKTKLQGAQDRIVHSLVGLIILVAAYSIVDVIGNLLGIDIFLTDPSALIEALQVGGGI